MSSVIYKNASANLALNLVILLMHYWYFTPCYKNASERTL